MRKKLLAMSIGLALTGSVYAGNEGGVEAYLGAEYNNWDADRNIEKEVGGAFGLGYNISDLWAIEGWYGRTETEVTNTSINADAESFSLKALRYLEEGKTRPFFSFGASHLEFDPDLGKSTDDTSIDLGMGVKHYFDNNVLLRGDIIARAYENSQDNVKVDPTVRLTLGYLFGGSSKKTSAPVAKPEPAVAPEPKAPVDSDGDGVPNEKDQCPGTPENLKVDENGCKVLLTETVSINLNVQFPNNSDAISNTYLAEIESVAKFMQQYEGTVVEVKGYTDDRGSEAYNQNLSEKRAKAVANKLISEFGLDSSRVNATGYGEANPIADNATAEGRAENRRVVAEVSTRVEKAVTK